MKRKPQVALPASKSPTKRQEQQPQAHQGVTSNHRKSLKKNLVRTSQDPQGRTSATGGIQQPQRNVVALHVSALNTKTKRQSNNPSEGITAERVLTTAGFQQSEQDSFLPSKRNDRVTGSATAKHEGEGGAAATRALASNAANYGVKVRVADQSFDDRQNSSKVTLMSEVALGDSIHRNFSLKEEEDIKEKSLFPENRRIDTMKAGRGPGKIFSSAENTTNQYGSNTDHDSSSAQFIVNAMASSNSKMLAALKSAVDSPNADIANSMSRPQSKEGSEAEAAGTLEGGRQLLLIDETALGTLQANQKIDPVTGQIVLVVDNEDDLRQLVAMDSVKAQVNTKASLVSQQSRKPTMKTHHSLYSKSGQDYLLADTVSVDQDGRKLSIEERLTKKAMSEYIKKKKRLLKSKRVFDNDKIAQEGDDTRKRTDLIASLLGNSKEAQDIKNKFRKMVEVPQEDFDLGTFKELTKELRNHVQKPSNFFQEQLKRNPRHQAKISTIEDFVTLMPTSAESGGGKGVRATSEQSMSSREQIGQSHDPLYTETGVLSEAMLAIADDPSRSIAIEAEASHRLSAPLIRALDSNLNTRHSAYEQSQGPDPDDQDESTFITNMVDTSYQTVPNASSLPTIKKVQTQSLANVAIIDQSLKNKVALVSDAHVAYNNEYQLQPIIVRQSQQTPSIEHSLTALNNDYRSHSLLDKHPRTVMSTLVASKGKQTTQALGGLGGMRGSATTLDVVPMSRSRLEREPTEISFSIGKRQAYDSASGRGRLLGDRKGYNHSQLSSVFGRESRVLKGIHDRVSKFESKQQEGSGKRLGYSKGMIEVYMAQKRERGAKTAALRKQSVPLRSKTKNGYYQAAPPSRHLDEGLLLEHTTRAASLEPIQLPQKKLHKIKSTGLSSAVNSLRQSQVELQRPGDDMYPDQEVPKSNINSTRLIYVDPKTASNAKSRASLKTTSKVADTLMLQDQSNPRLDQIETFNTQLSDSNQQVRPWAEESNSTYALEQMRKARAALTMGQEQPPINKFDTNGGTLNMTLAQNRVQNQSLLDQYKKRRTLVSNVQVSKLIRKDMNMFTGKDWKAKPRDKAASPSVAAIRASSQELKSPFKQPEPRTRNTMLDDESSEATGVKDLNVLASLPLMQATDGRYSQESLGSEQAMKSHRIQMTSKIVEESHGQTLPIGVNLQSAPSAYEQLEISESPEQRYRDEQQTYQLQEHGTDRGPADVSYKTHTHSSMYNSQGQLKDMSRLDTHIRAHESKEPLVTMISVTRQANKAKNAATGAMSRQDRSDRIQSEVNEYYRSLNQAVRNSPQKLSKVIIRGKNILQSTSGVIDNQNSSQCEDVSQDHRHVTQQQSNKTLLKHHSTMGIESSNVRTDETGASILAPKNNYHEVVTMQQKVSSQAAQTLSNQAQTLPQSKGNEKKGPQHQQAREAHTPISVHMNGLGVRNAEEGVTSQFGDNQLHLHRQGSSSTTPLINRQQSTSLKDKQSLPSTLFNVSKPRIFEPNESQPLDHAARQGMKHLRSSQNVQNTNQLVAMADRARQDQGRATLTRLANHEGMPLGGLPNHSMGIQGDKIQFSKVVTLPRAQESSGQGVSMYDAYGTSTQNLKFGAVYEGDQQPTLQDDPSFQRSAAPIKHQLPVKPNGNNRRGLHTTQKSVESMISLHAHKVNIDSPFVNFSSVASGQAPGPHQSRVTGRRTGSLEGGRVGNNVKNTLATRGSSVAIKDPHQPQSPTAQGSPPAVEDQQINTAYGGAVNRLHISPSRPQQYMGGVKAGTQTHGNTPLMHQKRLSQVTMNANMDLESIQHVQSFSSNQNNQHQVAAATQYEQQARVESIVVDARQRHSLNLAGQKMPLGLPHDKSADFYPSSQPSQGTMTLGMTKNTLVGNPVTSDKDDAPPNRKHTGSLQNLVQTGTPPLGNSRSSGAQGMPAGVVGGVIAGSQDGGLNSSASQLPTIKIKMMLADEAYSQDKLGSGINETVPLVQTEPDILEEVVGSNLHGEVTAENATKLQDLLLTDAMREPPTEIMTMAKSRTSKESLEAKNRRNGNKHHLETSESNLDLQSVIDGGEKKQSTLRSSKNSKQ